EISSIDPRAGVQGADIITNKRSIQTVVVARDGATVVLGGLMRDDQSVNVQRVPCLGAIPLLGEFFKFTETAHTKTNLLVFLRPHIIRDPNDLDAITSEKYLELEKLYTAPSGIGSILIPEPERKLPKAFAPPAAQEEKQRQR
ncbi:MAG: type II secretion system protein GspD, partial [Zetaproteobacteria bacterium]